MERITLLIIALFTTVIAQAQVSSDSFYSLKDGDGSFVVVIVLAVVFAGLFVFLLAIERKLKRLENKLDKES